MPFNKPRLFGLINTFKELCYPPVCISCNTNLPFSNKMQICPACLKTLAIITAPFCRCCGLPFANKTMTSHLCTDCLGSIFNFKKARSILIYNAGAAKLIKSFKYGRRTTMLPLFKSLSKKSGHLNEFQDADLIVPVPLHLNRLRQRGFNQALLLAEILFADQRVEIAPDALTRTENTTQQTNLKGKERRRNLKNAFAVKNPAKIANRKIVIIDDVFTTGTTINECAALLLKYGACEVKALTIARTVDSHLF